MRRLLPEPPDPSTREALAYLFIAAFAAAVIFGAATSPQRDPTDPRFDLANFAQQGDFK